ncbi:MAG: hypothetical protein QXZ48_07295 [Zestosphaera sp.]
MTTTKLEKVKEFLNASCSNHERCDVIPEKTLEYLIKRVRKQRIKPIKQENLREKYRDLLELIQNTINQESSEAARPKSSLPQELADFLRSSGLTEFSYDDFRKWLESKKPLEASEWHLWERRLRRWAEEGYLGRKFLVGGVWLDYGPGKVAKPPSKEVRFVRISGFKTSSGEGL